MPLAGILVVDEAHPNNILHREDTLRSISIIIHQSEHSHIRGHLLAEHPEVIPVQLVPEQSMGEHHLGDSDSAAPSNVVCDPNLELSFVSFLLRRQKDIYFLVIVQKQWFEIAPIAEPEQRPEALLKLVLTYTDLLVNSLLAVFVNGKLVIEEEDGKLIGSFDLDLFLAEELDK